MTTAPSLAQRFVLPSLPWSRDAFEKSGISKETIDYHYDKHHAGYVRKLNVQCANGNVDKNASLTDLVRTSTGKVFNLAAQIWNHTFYWESMSPVSDGCKGSLNQAIAKDFGSFDAFMDEFKKMAGSHFGSGWIWLSWDKNGKGLVLSEGHDAFNPLRIGLQPILCIDIWEHAYYIDQRNNRSKYIQIFMANINWERLQVRFNSVTIVDNNQSNL